MVDTFVEVAVNIPQVTGMFHYHLPAALAGRVAPGSLEVVPFGPQTVQGIVFRGDHALPVGELRRLVV
jgi:hypothetical protein